MEGVSNTAKPSEAPPSRAKMRRWIDRALKSFQLEEEDREMLRAIKRELS